MTFLRAVGRFYGRYAQFGGRAGRAEFWWVMLHLCLLSIAVTVLFELLGADTSAPGDPSFALPAVGVTGLSRAWLLLGLVPVLGGIALFVMVLQPSSRHAGGSTATIHRSSGAKTCSSSNVKPRSHGIPSTTRR